MFREFPGGGMPEVNKESEAKFRLAISEESHPSRFHLDRNEDAVLGSRTRVKFETEFPPVILSNCGNREQYLELIKQWGVAEAAAAEKLAELKIVGLFDGISGGKTGDGAGLVGSRLVSSLVATDLATARLENGLPSRQVEDTVEAFTETLQKADLAVTKFNREHGDMGCPGATTALLARAVTNREGQPAMVCAWAGNTRLYRRRRLGEVEALTIDDTKAGQALRQQVITKEQYELINDAKRKEDVPEELLTYWLANNSFIDNRRVVGLANGNVNVNRAVFTVEPDDVFFLMTDGAHRGRRPGQLAEALARNDLDGAAFLKEAEDNSTNNDDASVVKVEIL